MTTEEMNITIALYMGATVNYGVYTFEKHPAFYIRGRWGASPDELWYHSRFDWLMPVWQKLRGELNPRQYKLDGHFRTDNRLMNLRVRIKEAITEEATPTTAHRLMVEAIELIKK